MPIYEYQCPRCKTEVELLELRGQKEQHYCPMDDILMERVFSVPATPKCKGEGCYKKSN
jgi:putative FmdB family regulatory protein